ncbi:MAG: MarR family transcriptional regulator [Oscillospiraceae bacterium]|nr:MarR family transcriptional regulator [Oscillospiraceae bacterium]
MLEVIPLHSYYGHYAKILHWCTDQAMTNALAQMELTAAQGHIMGYLAHRDQAPCSRDVEEAFRLSHPTVSGLLSRLEKKGFIEFRPDPADRRCKRIYILPKGLECTETMHRTIRETEEQMVRDFSEEEKLLFTQLMSRAIANMGGSPCHRKHKEETQI